MPTPFVAAVTAASAVLTVKRERTGTRVVPFEPKNHHASDDESPAKVTHSWLRRSDGVFGFPCFLRYAGLAHTTLVISPTRLAV